VRSNTNKWRRLKCARLAVTGLIPTAIGEAAAVLDGLTKPESSRTLGRRRISAGP
jgi:hypothetical protein